MHHDRAGVRLAHALLRDLGGRRHAADARDADHRIELAAGHEVHEVTADQAAEAGEAERHQTEDQQRQHLRVHDRLGFAQHAEQQPERQGRSVQHDFTDQIVELVQPGLPDRDAEEQREKQR